METKDDRGYENDRLIGDTDLCIEIPTVGESKESTIQHCPICLEIFNENDEKFLCENDHAFHKSCVDSWKNQKNGTHCPCCRCRIAPSPEARPTRRRVVITTRQRLRRFFFQWLIWILIMLTFAFLMIMILWIIFVIVDQGLEQE